MSETNGVTTVAPDKDGPMGSGTVGGLLAFCDYLINKGLASASAITPLKSAARQVFETVEGTDEIDELDVRSLNVEEYLDRFQVKAMGSGRYKPESVTAYRSRFSRIMDYYSNYLTSGAVPKVRLRGTAPNRSRERETEAPSQPVAAAPTQDVSPEASEPPGATGMISYPFPLQSGGIANLRLPVRLEQTDADRLGAFIRTLVYEPQKQLGAGSDEPVDEG
jgi:hypothetical protein